MKNIIIRAEGKTEEVITRWKETFGQKTLSKTAEMMILGYHHQQIDFHKLDKENAKLKTVIEYLEEQLKTYRDADPHVLKG